MHARTILTRGVTTGLRLGRGTADRVVTMAGPPLGRLTDGLVSRLRRQDPTTTATFTPSRRTAEPANGAGSVTPSSVARNIAPQRPTAEPARTPRPKSAPGAKLPPPRPSRP
jgi:hypothetical protein